MRNAPPVSSDDLLTTSQAAHEANVSMITIRRAVEAGKLHPLRTPGGHFRFRRSDLEAMMNGASA